jgi:hypothetical protein
MIDERTSVTSNGIGMRDGGMATGLAAVAVLVLGLSGCGGGSTASTSASTPTGAAGATEASGAAGPRFDAAKQQKIRQCLEAAGISMPTLTGRPSEVPSGQRPSGPPSGLRPSGSPGQGFGGQFADPKVRAALQACGITLPTRRPSGIPAAPATTG